MASSGKQPAKWKGKRGQMSDYQEKKREKVFSFHFSKELLCYSTQSGKKHYIDSEQEHEGSR